MRKLRQSPYHSALLLNLTVTAIVALLAGLAAFHAIDQNVETALKEEIRRDMRSIWQRSPEYGRLPDLSAIILNIILQMRAIDSEEDNAVYLTAAQFKYFVSVDGSSEQWPEKIPFNQAQWYEIDGSEMGVAPGAILVRTEPISATETLLVGRRLTARNSLLKIFVPALIGGFLTLGLLSSWLLLRLDKQYKTRISNYRFAIQDFGKGNLAARVPSMGVGPNTDDLNQLGSYVNHTLDEVQRLLTSLDKFSQVTAHELNLAVSRLREHLVLTDDAKSVYEADRLLELVTHILELSKVEATPGFAMQRISLEDVLKSIMSLFEQAFEDSNVKLIANIDVGDTSVLGSTPLIQSAITNLISNALKYAPPGSTVTARLQRNGSQLTLSIRDEGPGVEDTDINALARLGRESQTGGNGFGLRHVQAVAIRHGARFTIENASPGLNATLSFAATL